MKKNLFFSTLFLFISNLVFAQILNLTATQIPGNCSSNAQINVVATGGTSPYQFRLTAGASGTTYPTAWQGGTNFAGLKPGAYTVQVQDNIGATFNRNITVTTTYISLNLSNATSTASHCPLSPDGTITATVSAGRTPYSYRLLQGATEIKSAQSSNKFTSVTDGSYTVEVTDACGEIRTYATTVALNDYKWRDSRASDNDLLNSGYASGYPASPFDTTKMSNIYDGPILFTCDSIAFRIFNTLEYNGNNLVARNTYRRVFIKELATDNIVWDNTFRPSDWPGGYTSPSVHLKINTNYRFYFDDLCNDIDSADRNYNYANTDNYSVTANAQKVCGGYNLVINRPSNWNSKNRYNSPYDTITVISSTLTGDTTVGKTIVENFADKSLSGSPLVINGVTPGNTYTLQVKTLCGTYLITRSIAAPPAFTASIAVSNGACKINTALLSILTNYYPVTPGKMVYRINSGPGFFTDVNGNTLLMTYPVIDSVDYNSRINLRNFPAGAYSIDVWDQCGNKAPTINYTVTDADVLKISGAVTANQQCAGASSIAYNNIYNQRFSGDIILYKKNAGGNYIQFARGNNYTSATLPSPYNFTALADGDYRVAIVAATATSYRGGPITANTCDTLFKQDISLTYKLPAIDTADGYVCTPGGSDGKITLYGKNGVRPYEFQRVDGFGNPLSAYQTDSTFTGFSRGLYNFRIKDNCGNATLYAYQIDTLKNVAITPNTYCYTAGDALTLTADTVYQASYTWKFKPTVAGVSSIIANTRSIQIPSLDASNWGTYTISYTKPGCTTAKSTDAIVVNCFILPIELISFTASVNNQCEANLQWRTVTDKDTRYFEIQKSNDGATWISAGIIDYTRNNSGTPNHYTFQDVEKIQATTLYRLKMADIYGNYTFSNIIKVKGTCIRQILTLYPNPVKDKLTVVLLSDHLNITGKLYNAAGQLVLTKLLVNGMNTINTERLTSGSYSFQIMDNNGDQKTYKIIVKK